MKYISTRGAKEKLSFEEVLLTGLASDGGLYMPERWPRISKKQFHSFKKKSYAEIAFEVMMPFAEDSLVASDFKEIIEETYSDKIFTGNDVAPLREFYPKFYMLELFHGPTLAFKDVALQLLGRLFDHVLKKHDKKITIIGATSGDTGSAAIEGCRHSDRANIFILHPKGRVSDVQRKQMTTVHAPNVHNIAIEGTFDDCQTLVKSLFNDAGFRSEMNLGAVNSINWARVMAQIVYYFYAAAQIEGSVSFVVPTGNFGNVLAGDAARRMGLPIKTLAIATNRNDILTRFFESGEMKRQNVMPTMSPSMDIQISSNFERYLFELLGRDADQLKRYMQEFQKTGSFKLNDTMQKTREDFAAYRCSEEETQNTMRQVYEETGYILDPHSAVGVHAARQLKNAGPIVALATAHPAKFPESVEKAIGILPAAPDSLAQLLQKEEHFDVLPNDSQALEKYIRSR